MADLQLFSDQLIRFPLFVTCKELDFELLKICYEDSFFEMILTVIPDTCYGKKWLAYKPILILKICIDSQGVRILNYFKYYLLRLIKIIKILFPDSNATIQNGCCKQFIF